MKHVIVLGGAGFVGSNIVRAFVQRGDSVSVVDGLMARSGGNLAHLSDVQCTLYPQAVADCAALPGLLEKADVVVDAMAWTSHLDAMRDPLYDLELNAASHLQFIGRLPEGFSGKIIYLGSRGQYGRGSGAQITEASPMLPDDVQGIHKSAADAYYRVFARVKQLSVASLRFPNCFGPAQQVRAGDIGLIGGFIRDVLLGKAVELYGRERYRSVVYARDIAHIVVRLADCRFDGYQDFNLSGTRLSIEEMVQAIIAVSGRGAYTVKDMPGHIRALDMGDGQVSEEKLVALLGPIKYTPLNDALRETINYFKEAMRNDLEM